MIRLIKQLQSINLNYTINDINKLIGHESAFENASIIDQLVIDSRKINFPETSLFFALKSEYNDGHRYISELYNKGVRNFVVSEKIDRSLYPAANFIYVANTLVALQTIATVHRNKFNYPVIGITGSNGKTILKEWLFQLLNYNYDIVRSPKSYNSQVGVPLSVWQMNIHHELAIFEAGISTQGEMDKLAPIINPEIGVFTFLGDAHAEGFESRDQKIKEKLKLFSNSKVLVYCADEKELDEAVEIFKKTVNPSIQLFAWSRVKAGFLRISNIVVKNGFSEISCRFNNKQEDFLLPFTDEASVHNAITCIAVLLYFKIPSSQIAERLLLLRPLEMRLELKQGINGCSIINDSYSADINSLGIALDFLEQQQQHNKRTLILSDLLQSGQKEEVLYKNIAAMLQQKKLYRFIGIGPKVSKFAADFSQLDNSYFFDSTEAFLNNLSSFQFSDETVLLKGARVFQFEKISSFLEQKMHQTVLEIDLNALRHNIKIYRQQLNKSVKLMCMVKAFSYGSGSFEIASLLQHAGVDYLAVAYADEGVELRKAGIRLPIMVMNTEEAGFDNMIRYQLEPELYSFKILDAFKNYLRLQNITSYPVHIKIDTGMHRLGFEENQLQQLCELLSQTECFKIQSVFSHLAAGGDKQHDVFTKQQAALLAKAAFNIRAVIGYDFISHIANTSAIHKHPDLQLDMVRLGIGMYGVDSDAMMQQQLKNVTTLKTTISQIKYIKKGESIGYSRSAIAEENKKIATVRIGYADGYPRILSNGVGFMLVNGQPAPVIGRICMDMTMLDITGIKAEEEDEVIVFGAALPVTSLANWAHTIEYEILTSISQRVRRIYFEE